MELTNFVQGFARNMAAASAPPAAGRNGSVDGNGGSTPNP
jgi:hypothetical protein